MSPEKGRNHAIDLTKGLAILCVAGMAIPIAGYYLYFGIKQRVGSVRTGSRPHQ